MAWAGASAKKRGWGWGRGRSGAPRDEARVRLMPIYIGKGRRSSVTGLDSRLRERQEKYLQDRSATHVQPRRPGQSANRLRNHTSKNATGPRLKRRYDRRFYHASHASSPHGEDSNVANEGNEALRYTRNFYSYREKKIQKIQVNRTLTGLVFSVLFMCRRICIFSNIM